MVKELHKYNLRQTFSSRINLISKDIRKNEEVNREETDNTKDQGKNTKKTAERNEK